MKKHYKKTKNLFLLVLILQLFTNCNYEFSEDYYKEIDQSFPIITSLSLEDFQNNITLYSPLSVVYNYDGNNKHRLYRVSIFIDNNIIKSSSNISNEFYIDTDKLSEGNHILKIEYLFSSGTGSLADVSNLEAYIATEEYNFTIDKSPPNSVVISSAEIVDGTIYIKWEPITNFNFDSAELSIKSLYNVNEKIQLSKDDLIKQTYNDQINSDNNLKYSIKLTNRYAESISNEVEISFEQIKVTKEIINDQQYKLTWTKHPLYNNIDYLTCTLIDYQMNSAPELSPLGGEYIINQVPIFADDAYDNFNFYCNMIIPEYGDIYTSTIYINTQFGGNFTTSYCKDYLYNPAEDVYYGVKISGNYPTGYQIYKLRSEDLAEISLSYISTGTSISYYSNIIVDPISNDILVDLSSKSFMLDKTTLQIKSEWNAIDYGITETYISTHFRNNYLFIANFRTKELLVFDVDSKELIYKAEYNYLFKVSNDGKYFYNNNGIYELNNGVVNFVTSTDTDGSVHSFEFLTNQNKCIYSDISKHPVIFDFGTKIKTSLDYISEVRDIRYDTSTNKVLLGQYHTDEMGGSDLSFVYILDLNSNEMKSLQVYDTHTSGQFYTYSNGKIIFSKGLFLDY